MIPDACTDCRARARPSASKRNDPSGSGPREATASLSVGPGTYSVAIHGLPCPADTESTAGVYGPRTI